MSDKDQVRYGYFAVPLPKRRHSSLRNPADVDEYNNRQVIQCKETRPSWHASDVQPGPPGQRHATAVARVERAIRHVPKIELAAYLAKLSGKQAETNLLVDRMEQIIRAESENWSYYETGSTPQTRLLASIVVEEWLHPAKYWRIGESIERPRISSFARIMECSRQTWRVSWQHRFEIFRGYPERWYQDGLFKMRDN